MTRPLVTVVVCTYNRAHVLQQALESLMRQETDGAFDYEVLVVNNASTDRTPEVVETACAQVAGLIRLADEPVAGIAVCRNRGITEAHGAWIAFFDDDQLADPQWLASLMDTAQRQEAHCVGGQRTLALPDGTQRALAPFCRILLTEDPTQEKYLLPIYS